MDRVATFFSTENIAVENWPFDKLIRTCLLQRLGVNKAEAKISIFEMADMPFLCRDLSFLPKLLYHRNVSLAV